MRVFVFEFVTGGGGSAQELAHAPSLAVEGDAMLKAVIADFVALGVDVVTLRSADLPPLGNAACEVQRITTRESLWTAVTQTAAGADWTLIIAPETDGTLAECCRRVLTAGGRLLGPGLETVQIAADKQATAEWLAARGVAVAEGGVWRGAAAELREFPVVMKPRTGAGSQGIALVKEPVDLAAYETDGAWRWERLCAGTSASVAVCCGPSTVWPLPPCGQRLAGGGDFTYLGGWLPLPEPLASRATRLAGAAAATLPDAMGYVGIDLVLGTDGDRDRVIEINPRLTTSYVGLRAACRDGANLAAAMLACAVGDTPRLEFSAGGLEFDPDGTVRNT